MLTPELFDTTFKQLLEEKVLELKQIKDLNELVRVQGAVQALELLKERIMVQLNALEHQ